MNYRTIVHIADIHFGAIDPIAELAILEEQFLTPISRIQFDILSIDGDLFDRRFSANHPAITVAINFVNKCANLCITRGAKLILLSGTESHDAGQLNLFYSMADSMGVDLTIVERTQFIYTHGLKILCIPEEYGKGAAYYEEFLKHTYDMVFMHGTLVGGIPGATQEDLNARREPVFSIDSFSGCKGPIVAGHVHTAMCLQQHMYYVSSPVRWRFGEEQDKGYAIVLYDMDTRKYDYNFRVINSYKYLTVGVNDLTNTDPNEIIRYLEDLKLRGVDYIRFDCKGLYPYQIALLSKYSREHNNAIKLLNANIFMNSNGEIVAADADPEAVSKLDTYLAKILLDSNMDEYTKFVFYLNFNEGDDYMTIDRLKKILSDEQNRNKIGG